jgi:hypothetical protein
MNIVIDKIRGMLKRMAGSQRGFTAIQTAIGMTASIIAAGSVAGAVVNAGTESSNAVEETITESIQNIEGTFIVKGDMAGRAVITGAHGTLGQLIFNVGLVLNDGSMNFTPPTADLSNNGLAGADSSNSIVVSYTDANQKVDNLYWTINKLGKNNGDNILEGGELFQIVIGSPIAGQDGGNLTDALNPDLSTNTQFVLELLHAQAPGLILQQKTPPNFTKMVALR